MWNMASRPDPSRQRPSSLAFAGKVSKLLLVLFTGTHNRHLFAIKLAIPCFEQSSLPDGPTSGRMRSPEEARAVSSGAEEINGPKNRGLASNGGLRSFASSDRPPSRAGGSNSSCLLRFLNDYCV